MLLRTPPSLPRQAQGKLLTRLLEVVQQNDFALNVATLLYLQQSLMMGIVGSFYDHAIDFVDTPQDRVLISMVTSPKFLQNETVAVFFEKRLDAIDDDLTAPAPLPGQVLVPRTAADHQERLLRQRQFQLHRYARKHLPRELHRGHPRPYPREAIWSSCWYASSPFSGTKRSGRKSEASSARPKPRPNCASSMTGSASATIWQSVWNS